jgi:O-acetyl-ADP-ribose deacetylase (regulator of RNase III)
VIHAVGPVWRGGGHGEEELLRSCYAGALALAAAGELHTVAFPAISTGAYGFPIERAARIALGEGRRVLGGRTSLSRVVYCCWSGPDLAVYEAAAAELLAGDGAGARAG